ncbi:MAG TPA: 23S rRNA (guanosine(2251)-2'-O)-methyltransferase RlmB [Candidatus Dormibacteraeota bacterium]|nr:23S rRNA (guanosine(2251)-2'-O)-methyltransferase RlmB [Candidatus Dormibacteraeota bacterium]
MGPLPPPGRPARTPDETARRPPSAGPPTPAARRQARERPAADRPVPERRAPAPRRRDDVIFGRNAVLEAARAGRVRRVLVAAGLGPDPRLDELRSLVPVQEAAPARVEAMAQGAHQGVVAELLPRTFLTLRQLLDGSPTLLLALDSIEDPQNLGAILRSAEAAGVDGVVLPERRSAPLSGAAVKASSGASEHLRICRVPGLPSAVADVRRAGLWCVALDPRGEALPWEFDLRLPVCIVVGGEGAGVHRLVKERCDARLRLPMAGRVASLNASAAASALLYEVARQRSR